VLRAASSALAETPAGATLSIASQHDGVLADDNPPAAVLFCHDVQRTALVFALDWPAVERHRPV
jgi:hypothetical protein